VNRLLTLVLGAVLLVVLATPASAADDDIGFVADINGQDLATADDPIELDPSEPAVVHVEVTNGTADPVAVRDIVLEGVVMGIPFLAYDIDVNLDVAPGDTEEINYEIPLRGIADQAKGLLPATLSIHDAEGDQLGSVDFTVDVKGSSGSLFAKFGWFLLAITVVSFGINLWLVLRRRLPPNRITRGLRFAITGIGIGLTLTVTLAILGLVTPTPGAWLPMVLIPTLAAFVLGYVSPGPLRDAWPEDEVDRALKAEAEKAESDGKPDDDGPGDSRSRETVRSS
jgi:hypothetical protein